VDSQENVILVNGKGITPNFPCHIENPKFKCRGGRPQKVRNIVLLETYGNTYQSFVDSLMRRKKGVHFILDRGGVMHQHVDLDDRTVYAKWVNADAVTIAVVNPHNLPLCRLDEFESIKPPAWYAPTKAEVNGQSPNRYVLPTQEQMRALELALPEICILAGVPFVFPTAWSLDRHEPNNIEPGIVARRDFDQFRNDGRFFIDVLARHFAKAYEIEIEEEL